jgi:5-(aminomethyl)-3-furanmethanol phosphate kinase
LNITVIKLGGSLMRSSELGDWLDTIQSLAAMTNIIIVPGGGEFADKVRETQASLGFDDRTAHRLALLAMSQYGYLLAGLNQNLHVAEDLESLTSSLDKSIPLLWLPTALLQDDSEIPASWDYTSDSIALWLATKLTANSLVLVKAKALKQIGISVEECIKKNTLDEGFQKLTDKFQGEIHLINKSHSQQLIDLF